MLPLILLLASVPSYALDVQGHRGARARYPENTLPAFEHALKAGADTLELDLGVTKDRVLVISHDQHLSPKLCLHGDGTPLARPILIHDLALTEIKTFDCGSLKNRDFPKQVTVPGTQIPTLQEFFSWIQAHPHPRAKAIRFNIETKIKPEHPHNTVTPEEFVELLLKEIQRARMSGRVIVQSFDPRTLVEIKKRAPRIPTALLTDDPMLDALQALQKYRADIFSPRHTLITPRLVRKLHANGYRVISYTPNTPRDWRRQLNARVDGIITDDPEALLHYLHRPRKILPGE